MSTTIDFSNWADSLFQYSLKLICNKGILEYDELSGVIQFSTDYQDKQRELLKELLEAHLYWNGLGVGVECLAKSVLIKHEVMSIKKRNILDKIPAQKTSFNSYQELQQYRISNELDDIHKVYGHALSSDISANTNSWLNQQFKSKDINHPFEINTPTLGKIYNSEIRELLNKGTILQDEFTFLNRSLELFTIIRRNVDSHIFLKLRVIGSINHDIENVYIPMINLLIKIYNS